jgi:hypothetical protein
VNVKILVLRKTRYDFAFTKRYYLQSNSVILHDSKLPAGLIHCNIVKMRVWSAVCVFCTYRLYVCTCVCMHARTNTQVHGEGVGSTNVESVHQSDISSTREPTPTHVLVIAPLRPFHLQNTVNRCRKHLITSHLQRKEMSH